MTVITHARFRRGKDAAAVTRRPASGVARAALAVAEVLLAWQERLRQRRHLSGLDDRLLKDIGLSRADVQREVEKPFWQG
jgi:uncharacterized protein YjiS (DUF1127 family)